MFSTSLQTHTYTHIVTNSKTGAALWFTSHIRHPHSHSAVLMANLFLLKVNAICCKMPDGRKSAASTAHWDHSFPHRAAYFSSLRYYNGQLQQLIALWGFCVLNCFGHARRIPVNVWAALHLSKETVMWHFVSLS